MAILEEPIKEVVEIKNYINGEWVESKGEIKDVVNPAKCETIAKVPISTKDEIDAAEQSKPLMADLPRLFVLIAKKRDSCVAKLRELC